MGDSTIAPETAELTRGMRLWQKARDARDTYTISLWRARLVTASFKETEGLPKPIRRAKAFEKIVTQIPIGIDDEQLLVGDFSAWPGGAEYYPDFSTTWAARQLEVGRLPYGLDEKAVAELKEIQDYWADRNMRDSFLSYIDQGEREKLEGMCDEGAWIFTFMSEVGHDAGWYCLDYEKAIGKGLSGILNEVEEELKATPIRDNQTRDKTILLRAITIELKAAIQYSRRYAAKAKELAKTAKGTRKSELEKMAEICDWVPANPARTFHEALQTMWFVHVLLSFEAYINGWAPGRVDQYLYPYYKKDIDEGVINKEKAISLLECLRVKMSCFRWFEDLYSHTSRWGETQFHNCTLGGQTPDGKDAVNELSYLWLESAFRVRSPHPTLSVRWHENLSPDFAMRAAELCRLGMGYPAWFGDKTIIQYCTGPSMGATLEEARDYQISGCIISTIPHKTAGTWPVIMNMGKVFELALYNGFDPTTGEQWGPQTGRFEDMKTWNDVCLAFSQQFKYFITEAARTVNHLRIYRALMMPQIWSSAFLDDCIKRGQDAVGGGCRYQGSAMYLIPCGIMDVVDSLAAIKKVIFDEAKISKEELVEALGANFEGYEDTRQLLLSSPKYGNDDDYVDNIAVEMYKLCVKICTETDACYGAKYVCAPHTLGFAGTLGKRVGALPSGRLSGVSLAEGGVSPCQGVDARGPTATINSAGKIEHLPILGTLFNMKFHPSALATREDLLKFLAILTTYFNTYGGEHIQFNVVSRETLLDAQMHPELHRNLVVRVAGYSALWVELERNLQDEIIARTEKTW